MDILECFKILVCVHSVIFINVIISNENCCRTYTASMTCEGCIPVDVPVNVSHVAIFAVEFANYANTLNFQGKNWNNVKTLDIVPEVNPNGSVVDGTHAKFTLRSKTFINLKSLVSLRFSSIRMNHMEYEVFKGLTKLEKLDLSDCSDITIETITFVMEGSNLSNLRILILRNASLRMTPISNFDVRFFNALSSRRIEHIDFSYISNSLMNMVSFSNAFPNLQSLNFERSGYLTVNFVASCILFGNHPSFTNLRSINLNFPHLPESTAIATNDDLQIISPYIHNFTEIRARGITPSEGKFSVHIYATRLHSSVRISLHFVGRELKWNTFHLSVNDDDAIAVEILDIGDNCIEQVDNSFLTLGKNLKYLDVSINRLFKMNETVVAVMLHKMTKLEFLNCSHNGINSVPREIFKYSLRLKIIDLSFNLIKSLDVNIFHLFDLELLDLSGNLIKVLTHDRINQYQNLLSSSINMNLKINITRNPLKCTCQTIDFVRWLSSLDEHSVFYQKEKFMCNLDKVREIPVDTNAVSEVDYLCKLPYIIISITVSVGACVLAVLTTGVYCTRRYQKKQREANLRRRIEIYKMKRKNNRNGKEFPVFLSYSSSDAQKVDSHVLPALNESLQRILGTEERCVVTGDLCFTPGHHVVEEIAKCIESCSVLVACVSKAFCQSVFCEDELLAAKHDNIPMILLFLEEVDIKKVPKIIQKHFKTITRTKLMVSDTGVPIFVPCVDTICKGIINLMKIDVKKTDLHTDAGNEAETGLLTQ